MSGKIKTHTGPDGTRYEIDEARHEAYPTDRGNGTLSRLARRAIRSHSIRAIGTTLAISVIFVPPTIALGETVAEQRLPSFSEKPEFSEAFRDNYAELLKIVPGGSIIGSRLPRHSPIDDMPLGSDPTVALTQGPGVAQE